MNNELIPSSASGVLATNEPINGLSQELSAKIATSLNELKSDERAYSAATWSMVRHCWGHWTLYCGRRACVPLPVNTSILRDYLLELSQSLAVNSVEAHLTAINFVQRNADLPSVTREGKITRAMRIIRRLAAERRETARQAIPMRFDDLRLLVLLYRGSDRLIKLRDMALLVTAYHTLLREAEVTRLKVRDIEDGEASTGAVYVAQTKTNVSGEAEYRVLSDWGLKIVRDWIKAAELSPDDYLFCKVNKHNQAVKVEKPLSGVSVDSIFARAYLALGNEPKDTDRYTVWSGHSARVGAALDLAASGASIPQIMQAGGWKSSNTVMGYIRRISLTDNPILKLTGLGGL
ncbi:tyrosine-type recombinase/integrase [Edwardsiella tarda]|uniref:tyrosine-type recombinase/integrase n=1 Tax=Edwardsiella tarda TaxID=636 RepID=UPI00351C2DDE